MAKGNKSTDDLVREIADAVREEMRAELQPALTRIAEAASELEAALGDISVGKRPGAGRPRGTAGAKRVGRPSKRKKKAARKTGRPRKGAGRAPRGALRDAIEATLRRGGQMALTDIRDAVMRSSYFRGRDEMTLYRQIVRDIGKMPNVRKAGKGRYALK